MPRRSQKNTLKEAIQVFLAQGGSMDEINEITTQLSAEKEKEESKSTENSSKEVSGAGAGEEKADTPNQARAQTLSGDGSEGGIDVATLFRTVSLSTFRNKESKSCLRKEMSTIL